MTMEEELNIQNGDQFKVVRHGDGWAVRVQNTVWEEEPRYLSVNVAGAHDRDVAILDLIDALQALRKKPLWA